MTCVEEVKAEVIDLVNLAKAPEPAITYQLPTATIKNIDDIDNFVTSIEKFFGDIEIDVDDPKQVKQLKDLRADVNKVAKAIDDKRKAMDKDIKGAIAQADGVLNGLRDRVRAVYDASGKQMTEAAERQRKARLRLLAGEYEATAPDLMKLIPIESFIAKDPKLVSRDKRFTGNKACDLLAEMIAEAVHDRAHLRCGDIEFSEEADMVYCSTLDLRAALYENDRLKKIKADREEHERKAKELQESIDDRRGVQPKSRLGSAISDAAEVVLSAGQVKSPTINEPTVDTTRYLFRLEFESCEADGFAVRDFMRTMPGIKGKSFKREVIDA